MATVNRISMPSGRALLLIVVSNLLGDVLKGAVVMKAKLQHLSIFRSFYINQLLCLYPDNIYQRHRQYIASRL